MNSGRDRAEESPTEGDWIHDEEHCQRLLACMADPRIGTLNGARMLLVGECPNGLASWLEVKSLTMLSVRLYRTAWAGLDQMIEGGRIVDPLHPVVVRARAMRVVAMCCAGFACCAEEEVQQCLELVPVVWSDPPSLVEDLHLAAAIIGLQRGDGEAESLFDDVAASFAQHEWAQLTDRWFGPEGLYPAARDALAGRARQRPARRVRTPLDHLIPAVGSSGALALMADYGRVALFGRNQRADLAAIARITGHVGPSPLGRRDPTRMQWSWEREKPVRRRECQTCRGTRQLVVRPGIEHFPLGAVTDLPRLWMQLRQAARDPEAG